MLVVSIKYALFVLRADDNGQGGVFAMLAQLHKKMGDNLGRGLILTGLFGSSLLYGDGLITPVISVLSALEGLEVATSAAKPVVVPLTCCVLFLLFWAQSRGTGRLGKLFGPVMILWFAVIAILGVAAISRMPSILDAVNPAHGVRFFLNNGLRGFFLLGAVVLCVTGCEALYADMGHFGARAIQISWYFMALPALLLNYFGQGALILLDSSNAREPFYGLVPQGFLYPMVVLATEGIGYGVYRVIAHYGFMEAPDIPQIMSNVKAKGLNINLDEVTYFVGRISLVRDLKRTMPRWRRFLFTFMLRNSLSGSSYLNIPPSKVMEIGVQMPY